jgi:hypothetical protein
VQGGTRRGPSAPTEQRLLNGHCPLIPSLIAIGCHWGQAKQKKFLPKQKIIFRKVNFNKKS